MRQTAPRYMATVAAALVMSCAISYATRANLSDSAGSKSNRAGDDFSTAAPVEFVRFPGESNLDIEIPSIDLSMTTLRGFIALSNDLGVNSQWSAIASPIVAADPIGLPANANTERKAREAAINPLDRIETSVDRIEFKTPVLAPVAFLRFCARYSDDCKFRSTTSDHSFVSLTKDRFTELTNVNREVNRSIKPQENLAGVLGEEWLVAPRYGDCNDFAVTKRHELLERGWPSHALLLTEVVVASGEHHLILVVRTREDDLVLDNLSTDIRPVSQIGYRWVRAQQAENPKFWSAIDVKHVDRVAMNSH